MAKRRFYRPAILDGCNNRTNRFLCWIYTYSSCHAWVCDGYMRTWNACYNGQVWYHMNWGWDGFYDGWYNFNQWNPGSRNYQYCQGLLHNINP
ncbi:MAG: C10 family peptidase [Saprospiraceae bacterium]|nr:C10 family peptidase [Saprospiraceae bacterium]